MKRFDYPHHPTEEGYLTAQIRRKYIDHAIAKGLLPENAQRMAHVISLDASNHAATPVQFWQLYSILGPQRITFIVTAFYQRVYQDEEWFRSVFERISGMNHHIQTQASMWADVMGGGRYYHGGEYRLNFHHTHNAFDLMNDKGAERWVSLMRATLDEATSALTGDPRVRTAVNTFLTYFMAKYADEFGFSELHLFGDTNPPLKERVNLLNMTTEEIENLPQSTLIESLTARGVDVSQLPDRQALINKALRL